MSDNPWEIIPNSINAAIQQRSQRKKQLLDEAKFAFEKAMAEKKAVIDRLNDKNLTDAEFEVQWNKYAALENQLSGGKNQLPGLSDVMPEDRKLGMELAKISQNIIAGITPKEDGLKAMQMVRAKMTGANLRDREGVQKDFNDLVENLGVTGDVKTFQEGNKDVTGQVNKFGEVKPIASAPNMEQFNAETGRMNAETSRMQAENESARAGAKSSSETVSTARALIDALNSYDKGKKTDIYNKLNNVADWAVPDFLTDPNQLDNQKIRAKVVDLLSQKLGTEGAGNNTMTDPLDEQATKLLKAAGKAVTPETLKIVKQRLQQTKQKPKGINPNTGAVRG